MDLGRTIKSLRLQNGLTQDQFADALDISTQTISRWENNVTIPDIDAVIKLATYFNVSTDFLLEIKKPSKVAKLLRTREVFECQSSEQADELIMNFKSSYFPKLLSYVVKEEDGKIILTVEKEFGAELNKMQFERKE